VCVHGSDLASDEKFLKQTNFYGFHDSRQRDRETDIHTDRQTDRHTNRHTNRQKDRHSSSMTTHGRAGASDDDTG